MQHLHKINDLLEHGNIDEAKSALDNLLLLGPNNLEGLKLKALMYSSEGRFQDEAKVWQKIFEIDSEDHDALQFLQQKHLEDREHFYFTDDLPNQGKRYLAYPRSLVNISIFGLLGCVSFLLLAKGTESFQLPNYALVLGFMFLVIAPWIAIIYIYCRSLRSVTITREHLEIATRFRLFKFEWKAIEKLCLCHSANPNKPNLRLVIVPKDKSNKGVIIDYNESSSAIRARSYLAMELKYFYSDFSFEAWERLEFDSRQFANL